MSFYTFVFMLLCVGTIITIYLNQSVARDKAGSRTGSERNAEVSDRHPVTREALRRCQGESGR